MSAQRGVTDMMELHQTLTPIQAAKYLGISEAVLRLWRSEGKGPRHFKAGEKLIRYRRADLDSWIEARLSEPSVSR
jgi:excisionase family DNA binding protein